MPEALGTNTCSMLAQGDAREDRLVTIFGHELRSHLAPIKNAADLLKRSALDLATARRAASIIERQVDGMTRLVDELLASAQSKASQLTVVRRADTVVEAIVKRSVEMVEPSASLRRQTLSIRMPAEPTYIVADELWLTQAVQTLIGNAVKYTDPGGQIEIDVRHDENDVAISIRDTGIGFGTGRARDGFRSVCEGR